MKKSFLIISTLAFMGCAKIDNMFEMPNKMDDLGNTTKDLNQKTGDMGNNLNKTSDAIHKQILLLSLQGLLDSKNWDVLAPAPLKLMPYGKTFAEEATPQEIIELTYAMMKEITETKQQKDQDAITGASQDFTQAEATEILKEKRAKHTILKIIAGFAQDEKIKEVVSSHIRGNNSDGSRRFQDTALALLAMRAEFLNDTLISDSSMKQPLTNIGMVEEAIRYTKKLDMISKFKFADMIAYRLRPSVSYVDATGAAQTARLQLSYKLDLTAAPAAWRKIKVGIENDLQIAEGAVGENSHDNDMIVADEKVRAINATSVVDSYLKSWETKNP